MEQNLPKRNEVPEALTWRLSDIYETKEAWEQDLAALDQQAEALKECEGKVGTDAASFLNTLKLYEAVMETYYRLASYASMKHDEDTADDAGTQLDSRAQMAGVRVMETTSFLEPEIIALGEEKWKQFEKELPEIAYFHVTVSEIFRCQKHALSKEAEKLLAAAGDMASVPSNSFGMLVNADMKFPSVTDKDGNEIRITNGRFVPLQMSPDRELRKEVFEAFYGKYAELKNTLASLYEGQVKQQGFYAKARHYDSAFEAAVDGNNVAPEVCDRLIESVHNNLDKMHRYVSLRKRLLGVDELHMYDVYVPMLKDFTMKVSYDEAVDTAMKALAPLGEDYLSVLKEAFENRWTDVVENEGKRGGAYSSGVYGVHPYVLLNYNNTLDDVFTLVHEMGHSLHTWYSSKHQSFFNSQYRIFVAEVASTTNEILLLEYLLGKAESKEEKAYLINHYLESFKGTLYRQTMFEEFERKTNEMAAEGTPLTADLLSKTYHELNKAYFGEAMVSDDAIRYEWSRIPHFYYNFYVYQYATSFAASVAIAHRILEEGAPARDQYLAFLRSGCTEDPVSLLKKAGVDLSTAEPIDAALKVFEHAIEEMEALFPEK